MSNIRNGWFSDCPLQGRLKGRRSFAAPTGSWRIAKWPCGCCLASIAAASWPGPTAIRPNWPGLGIAVVQRPIGLPDPRLQPVLPELPVPRLDTWIVTHEDLRELPRVRALFDHLAEAFRSYQAIGGRCGAPANASPDWKEVR
jgi:hypothetical protein